LQRTAKCSRNDLLRQVVVRLGSTKEAGLDYSIIRKGGRGGHRDNCTTGSNEYPGNKEPDKLVSGWERTGPSRDSALYDERRHLGENALGGRGGGGNWHTSGALGKGGGQIEKSEDDGEDTATGRGGWRWHGH